MWLQFKLCWRIMHAVLKMHAQSMCGKGCMSVPWEANSTWVASCSDWFVLLYTIVRWPHSGRWLFEYEISTAQHPVRYVQLGSLVSGETSCFGPAGCGPCCLDGGGTIARLPVCHMIPQTVQVQVHVVLFLKWITLHACTFIVHFKLHMLITSP